MDNESSRKQSMLVQLIVSNLLDNLFAKFSELNKKLNIGESETFDVFKSVNLIIIGHIEKNDELTIFSVKTTLNKNSRIPDRNICYLFERMIKEIVNEKFQIISETEKIIKWDIDTSK